MSQHTRTDHTGPGGVARDAAAREEPVGGPFQRRFEVRWADLDANRHVRNTAFSEYATHTRFAFLASAGFPQARFEELRFGPVMFREETRFRREVLFGDVLTVSVRCSGLAADGSQWRVVQDVVRSDGREAAVLTIEGAWMDLESRRLMAPPEDLLAVMRSLPRTEGYEELSSLVRRR